jgi:hypothetical protein
LQIADLDHQLPDRDLLAPADPVLQQQIQLGEGVDNTEPAPRHFAIRASVRH